MTDGECAIWGTPAKIWQEAFYTIYDSPRAGGIYRVPVFMQGAIDQGINAAGDHFKLKITSWLVSQRFSSSNYPSIERGFNYEELIYTKRLAVSKRIERFFRYCIAKNINPGDAIYLYVKSQDGQTNIELDSKEIYAWTETLNFKEFQFFKYLLTQSGYVQAYAEIDGREPDYDILSAKGFEKLEEYQATNRNSKQAFVAMWFDSSVNAAYENAIAPAIRDAGFEPVRIDRKEHNNKIDDEIIAELRRSRFVIADFTSAIHELEGKREAVSRGGVYYEAGFAHGMGIPVIWTCREDVIDLVHFDTRQYNHIVWKDADDLRVKLYNRIRATIT